LFSENHPDQGPPNSLKWGITEFTPRIVRKYAEYAAQAFIDVKGVGCEPKPPYIANIHRFVFFHYLANVHRFVFSHLNYQSPPLKGA
jgi:hypothetical protein